MNPLIVLFVLSMINSLKCRPNLCINGSQPLEGFTSITQLVNDSYLITDHTNHFSLISETTFPKFTQDFDKIKIKGSEKTMKQSRFMFGMSFVIDIDSECVNIPEILFVINFKEAENEYTYFTDDVWQTPTKMTADNTGHEVLNKINTELKIFVGHTIRTILYFQSIGILVITTTNSVLAYCSPFGWKVQSMKNSIVWIKHEINFKLLDTGFVDNEEKVIYLFESYGLSDQQKHLRNYFHECSYDFKRKLNNETNESKVSVTINCQKKPMDSFCSSEEKTDWFKIGSFIALIVLCLVIAIVLIAIVCLIPSFRGSTIGDPVKDNKTLVSDGSSRQIKPKDSLTTITTKDKPI